MKILLLVPPLSTKDRYGSDLGRIGPTCEPLGLAYLATSLRDKCHEVEILDTLALNLDYDHIKNYLLKNNFDLIGITILTPMYLRAVECIKLIKSLSKIPIIIGGPHVTIFPKETLEENKEIDYGVYGEGEETIIDFCDAFENKKSFSKIDGLIYREKNKVVINKPRQFLLDIDKIELPARDLLPMKKYVPAPTYYKKLPSYIMLTSRGCPYRCTCCSKISGNIYRMHSVERVLEEMKILMEDYRTKEIIFRDDNFLINRERVIKICNKIIKRGYNKKVKWTCMGRVNSVNLELLKLMKKAGCWSIHYGVESGVQRLLDLIKKDITLEQSKNAIKWTKEAGIESKAFFMIGLPTETKEETLQTINFAKEIDPDAIQVTITVPYPGTELYEAAKKSGELKSFKWEDYQTWAGWTEKDPVYIPEGRNAKELKEMQKQMVREFYLRPKIILRLLLQLQSYDMFKKYFLAGLAVVKGKFKK